MTQIPFRFEVANRIRESAGDQTYGDYCEKLMESALRHLQNETIPLFRTRRGGERQGRHVGNGGAIVVSHELRERLARIAHDSDISLIDLCTSLAAHELKMPLVGAKAESIGMLPLGRNLGAPRSVGGLGA